MIRGGGKREFVAECNHCGAEHAGGCEDDFMAFIVELAAEGWSGRREDDEWVHTCPDCQEAGP